MEEDNKKRENYNYENNVELIKEARNGNKRSLEKLIEMNLPLVASISKKFINRGYDYEDIFQIGSMGLIKAFNNFDDKYNVKFSTYAVPMIIGEIKRFIRDDGIIKVSRNIKTMARKLHFDKEQLTKKLNRSPTIEELSSFSGYDKEQVLIALEASSGMQYLYDTIHQEGGSPVMLIDKLSEDCHDDKYLVDKLMLKDTLKDLDLKSRQIIILRYFKDKTQSDVAKMLGISQVQVSRMEKKVLTEMKRKLKG